MMLNGQELSTGLCLSKPGTPADAAEKRLGRFHSQEGATIVEFAIASTMLCAILFGLIETCLAVYSYDFVAQAARQGARYAIVRGAGCTLMPDCNASSAQIQTYVKSLNYAGINTGNLTATATWYQAAAAPPNMTWTACTGQCNAVGNAVKVTVSYPFQLTIPFVPALTINEGSSSMMVISQ